MEIIQNTMKDLWYTTVDAMKYSEIMGYEKVFKLSYLEYAANICQCYA
jgi:hypothetical protein